MMPRFIMCCGLPASGKSTKAKRLADEHNAIIFSSDALREELFGDVNHQDNNQELFIELHRRIKDCLREGKSAIYDATNISYKRRMAFLAELKNIPCEKICILMATPYEECLKRNKERERKVPEDVIKRMYMNFQCPFFYEGWDRITTCHGDPAYVGYYGSPMDFVQTVMDFNQDNHHHSLSLGEHLTNTVCNLVCHNYDTLLVRDEALTIAALLHDNGKCQTKDFHNGKGEPTAEAHYFNHNNVGAYNSLFYTDSFVYDDIWYLWLYISVLIMWHMQPYFWEKDNNEKSHNKYRKLWGEELYQDIMKLHEADKVSH